MYDSAVENRFSVVNQEFGLYSFAAETCDTSLCTEMDTVILSPQQSQRTFLICHKLLQICGICPEYTRFDFNRMECSDTTSLHPGDKDLLGKRGGHSYFNVSCIAPRMLPHKSAANDKLLQILPLRR